MNTRIGNAKGELETLTRETSIFLYRVVNDKLDVSKRVIDLLAQGMYAEELTGQSTPRLIEETWVPKELEKGTSTLKIFAAVSIVGLIAAGVYMYREK